MQRGLVVFSPIAHTHGILTKCGMPNGWNYWEKFDREFIERSECVIVLKIDGWDTSKGVAAEIRIAEEAGIPVEYMEPDWVE